MISKDSQSKKARLIAYYLPQFHPIPENNEWWGPGFTEWTNVAKARPLFPGHQQPNLPADLGFYDLRVPETRLAQAELARTHGIEGFCYWHYWFGNGKRILERPFAEVLRSGEPDFPFCLAWANQSWTGIWHGTTDRILIEQTYPGTKDYEAHFYTVLDALTDSRYITVDSKPIFFVFRPFELPNLLQFTDCWRELALKAGFKGLHLVGILSGGWEEWVPEEDGFDAAVLNNLQPAFGLVKQKHYGLFHNISRKLTGKDLRQLYDHILSRPKIISYQEAIKHSIKQLSTDVQQYPGVMPNWDNTPRSNHRGVVFHNSNPELFRLHLREAITQVSNRSFDKRLVIVKSWNEWAEGNYLEPDQRFGRKYLEVVKEEVFCSPIDLAAR